MPTKIWLLGFAALIFTNIARADQSALEQRLNALEEEVRALKEQIAAEKKQAAAKPSEAPVVVTAGQEGFLIKSGDGNFQLKLGGVVQADARFYFDDHDALSDTFLVRRARPILEATVFHDFNFRLMPDFGAGTTVLLDAYVEWKHWPWLAIRGGKFKPPLGLELLQNDPDRLFVETAFPTALVPNREVGFQVGGSPFDGLFTYALGVFNGAPDGSSTTDLDAGDNKDVAARLFVHPFKKTGVASLQKLGLGVAGSIGDQQITSTTTNLPTYRTPGQQTFFWYRSGAFPDGERYRLAPQGYYYWGPVGFMGEYTITEQKISLGTSSDRLRHRAWQLVASYVLTGDDASYTGVNPKRPFNLKTGDWGAFEIAGRYQVFDADNETFPTFADSTKSASKATGWGVGLNWYLSRNVRSDLDYEQTYFDGGATSGSRATEKVFFTRLQLKF
jgi:phosphate-selective porin OprO/OprP